MEQQNRNTATRRVIVVSGIGHASAKPNRAALTLGAATIAPRASDALKQNATIMNRVMDVVKQVGVPQQDTETTMFRLHPNYMPPRVGRSGEQRLAGFEALHLIKVFTNQSLVSEVLDRAVDAGANRINNVSFTLPPETLQEVQMNARQNAIADARAKAEVIASSVGVNIVSIASVIENDYSRPPRGLYREGLSSAVATIMPPSEATVQVSIRVTYIIE